MGYFHESGSSQATKDLKCFIYYKPNMYNVSFDLIAFTYLD